MASGAPHLAGLGAEPSLLPIEDVHGPLCLQWGSHGHVQQPVSIEVRQGGDRCSKAPQGVARVPV